MNAFPWKTGVAAAFLSAAALIALKTGANRQAGEETGRLSHKNPLPPVCANAAGRKELLPSIKSAPYGITDLNSILPHRKLRLGSGELPEMEKPAFVDQTLWDFLKKDAERVLNEFIFIEERGHSRHLQIDEQPTENSVQVYVPAASDSTLQEVRHFFERLKEECKIKGIGPEQYLMIEDVFAHWFGPLHENKIIEVYNNSPEGDELSLGIAYINGIGSIKELDDGSILMEDMQTWVNAKLTKPYEIRYAHLFQFR